MGNVLARAGFVEDFREMAQTFSGVPSYKRSQIPKDLEPISDITIVPGRFGGSIVNGCFWFP